ncbi:NXPE family member 3-like [Argopecten irradians]|uniref:NXPE family member 3-like n=1 Tax=Argopecten irradians TaxID=31199 RepID=UPI003717FFE7
MLYDDKKCYLIGYLIIYKDTPPEGLTDKIQVLVSFVTYQLMSRIMISSYLDRIYTLSFNICGYETKSTIPNWSLERVNEYRQFTDLDILSLVNMSTSVVNVRKTEFRVGDEIIVDIVLYNGRGERATVGGDMLRVWLREITLKASVAGYVIDHGNGSYTGIVKAMWAGNPELMFAIGNTKEHIGIYMNVVQKYGVITFLKAGFKNKNLTENTLCSVVPNIPDVTLYCNFTAHNFNMSFFCGKPKILTCADWSVYERTDIHSCNKKHDLIFRRYRYMKKSITFVDVSKRIVTARHPQVSCRDITRTVTWHTTNPTGYFYNGQWQSLICKSIIQWEYTHYLKCLKNHPVLMTGDSTTRNWFVPLARLLRLNITDGRLEIKDKALHTFAEATTEGLYLSWAPHEIPFYSLEQNKDNFRSVASRIDALPSNKSAIVILHWFGHLTRTTPQQYRDHVRSAKEAVLRLLERSPNSDIFIKGPHSFTYDIFLEPFDYISEVYKQILYEEFRDLHHSVYFIDQWDATVGNENVNIHPEYPFFNEMMLNFVFSHIC